MPGCLSVCHVFYHKCDITQYLSQMKWDLQETFKVCQDLSPELIKNVCAHACVRMHTQRVKMCSQLLCLFCNFFVIFICLFLVILKPFLTENEKIRWPHLKKVSTRCNFLVLGIFFHFSKEILQNGWNMYKNYQNSTFLTLVAKIWNLRIKVMQ